MCSEIHHFSSVLRGMSDTRENQQNFLVKQREEVKEIGSESVRGDKKGEVNATESSVTGDGNFDGFKTPTSSDHKIPAIKQCPPPPRKSQAQKSKRKRDGARRSLRFDELAEVESIFRPPAPEEDDVNGSKRARKVTESDEFSS